MTRYRKKPVEVEAWQVGSDEPMPEQWFDLRSYLTLTENEDALRGAWIIKFTDDSFNVISSKEFNQTYEVVK